MLNLNVGTPVVAFGEDCIRTTPGACGHAVFGPYEDRPPGSYRVEFTLAPDEGEPAGDDIVCAVLDVVSNQGRTLFARREVRRSELAARPTRISLDFAVTEPANLEYRVGVAAPLAMLIADRRVVARLSSEIPKPPRSFPHADQRPAPTVFVDHVEDFRALYGRGAAIRFAGLDKVSIAFEGRSFDVGSRDELEQAALVLWPADGVAGRRGVPTGWEHRALRASERKARMMSFGPHAFGLLVDTRNGLFAVDPEDSSVTAALLRDGSYADDELALARSVVSPGGDVLVVGTHVGALAVPLAKSARELVAIEANPHTFTYLKANMALNGCTNATLHNLAAGDRDEAIKFLMNRDNSGGSKRMPVSVQEYYVYDDPEVIEIDAVPLDRLLGDRTFDLVFMDIEGSEYFALKGMPGILARAGALSVEFLPHHLRDVANVGIDDFIGVVAPHFGFLYVPGSGRLVEGAAIPDRLREMYAAGEQCDGAYFLKAPSESWLQEQGIVAAPSSDPTGVPIDADTA